MPEDLPISDSTQKTSENGNGGLYHIHRDAKEGVWLKLANRIKNLERNVTLSGAYLEELSVRYKKQIEDLQLAVKKSNDALSMASRFRQQERISVNLLQVEVANLTERVTNLTVYMETISVGAVYVHAVFLVLEITIGVSFLFICARRWKSASEENIPPTKSIQQTSINKSHIKSRDIGTSFCAQGTVPLENGLHIHSKIHKNSDTEKEINDISSTPSSSPMKPKRTHSLEDLFAIDEEIQGEIYPIPNGDLPHLNRRNSMVALSEPPPLTRKQRRRQQRKQVTHNSNRHMHHVTPNILLNNRVQEISAGSNSPPPDCITPAQTVRSHYHTIQSPSKDKSSGELPWKEVARSGSMDNLSTRPEIYSNQSGGVGRDHYVQTAQNSRFVVQPVVNVYLNSLVGNPVETFNKYEVLNNSLHDDPTPIKERSLNYGLQNHQKIVDARNRPRHKYKSKSNFTGKELFSETCSASDEEVQDVLSTSIGSVADNSYKNQTPIKVKRSKSNSPKRVGQNVKQRVLFKNFNPDNADWIQKY